MVKIDRCETCKSISKCEVCGKSILRFEHIGVRAVQGKNQSGIWHFANPCGHLVKTKYSSANVKYNGGPLWKNGYVWQNVYWGNFFSKDSSSAWVKNIEKATFDIESDKSYSGELSQYNVGIGKFVPFIIIKSDPPSKISDAEIKQALMKWINSNIVSNFGSKGAYNIFFPPGVTVLLSPTEASCKIFCDYHNSIDGSKGPFYTVEPYPCNRGCNQCNNNLLDTLVQGLSEEMVELKTDMDPGSGWVIGNEELCDFCDHNFVCNQLSTGEFVNSWYEEKRKTCWTSNSRFEIEKRKRVENRKKLMELLIIVGGLIGGFSLLSQQTTYAIAAMFGIFLTSSLLYYILILESEENQSGILYKLLHPFNRYCGLLVAFTFSSLLGLLFYRSINYQIFSTDFLNFTILETILLILIGDYLYRIPRN